MNPDATVFEKTGYGPPNDGAVNVSAAAAPPNDGDDALFIPTLLFDEDGQGQGDKVIDPKHVLVDTDYGLISNGTRLADFARRSGAVMNMLPPEAKGDTQVAKPVLDQVLADFVTIQQKEETPHLVIGLEVGKGSYEEAMLSKSSREIRTLCYHDVLSRTPSHYVLSSDSFLGRIILLNAKTLKFDIEAATAAATTTTDDSKGKRQRHNIVVNKMTVNRVIDTLVEEAARTQKDLKEGNGILTSVIRLK